MLRALRAAANLTRPAALLTAGAGALSLAPSAARAADLEVGPSSPFTTVQAAADAAGPGDVVRVHAGEYAESLSLAQSGSPGSPITITAFGDGLVTLRGAIDLTGDHWHLTDLTIVVDTSARGIDVEGSNNVMLRLDLSGGTSNGIDGSGVANEVRSSIIHDFDAGASDAHCIVLNPNAEGWIIADNELFDCSGDGVQLYGPSGVVSRDIRDTRIESNTIRWTGAIGRMENAIDVKNADGLVIERNVMSGFADNKTVVFQKGPIDIEMRCNVMFDGFTGVEFRGEDGGTVENITFERNLMHDFTSYALKLDGVLGARVISNTFVDATSDGLRVEGAGVGSGEVRNNLWLRTGPLDGGGFQADHNAYFDTGAVGFASASDVTADPMLDASYAPAATSPLIDAGVDAGLPFAGTAPDIGAAELGLDACGDVGGTGGGGSGGAGAGSGTTGASTGSAASGSGAGGDGAGAGAADGAGEGGDGCGCATPGERSSRWHLGVAALVGLLGGARLRRRARARSR